MDNRLKYFWQKDDKDELSNEFHNLKNEKPKVATIVEEKEEGETKFTSPCLTDQREDAFYKERNNTAIDRA